MSDPISNPIGFLQEFCMKSGNAAFPKYIESENHGEEPCKNFTCQCLYDGHKATGLGSNKKQAKYNAAKNMHSLLEEKDYFTNYNLPQQSNQGQDIQNNSQEVTSNPENFKGKSPISILQEYCQSKSCSMPNYIERSMGLSFNCECIVLDNKTLGNGTSIKCAKTEAAGKMCVKLGLLDGWNFKAFVAQPPRLEDSSGKNPISALQELCAGAMSLPKPVYRDNGRFANFFVVICIVGDISGEGKDLTKKGAKALAAQKVLMKLNQQTVSVNSDTKKKIPKLEDFSLISDDKDNAKVNNKSAVKLHPDNTPTLEEFSLTSDDADNAKVKKSAVKLEPHIAPTLEEFSLSSDDEDDAKVKKSAVKLEPDISCALESLNLDDSIIEVEPRNLAVSVDDHQDVPPVTLHNIKIENHNENQHQAVLEDLTSSLESNSNTLIQRPD